MMLRSRKLILLFFTARTAQKQYAHKMPILNNYSLKKMDTHGSYIILSILFPNHYNSVLKDFRSGY